MGILGMILIAGAFGAWVAWEHRMVKLSALAAEGRL